MVMLKSAVIPAFASAITLLQSTIPPAVMSARSVGVRATPARKRALYERANWMNCAAVSARPLIHVVGRGKPSPPAGAFVAIVTAESRYARAAVITVL